MSDTGDERQFTISGTATSTGGKPGPQGARTSYALHEIRLLAPLVRKVNPARSARLDLKGRPVFPAVAKVAVAACRSITSGNSALSEMAAPMISQPCKLRSMPGLESCSFRLVAIW